MCEISILKEKEQYYLDTLKPKYNIAKNATSPMLGRKQTSSKWYESRAKMIGKGNSFYGRHHTPETIQKIKDNMPNLAGEFSPSAKLTWDIVGSIRKDRKDNNISFFRLSVKYNISKTQILRIIHNKSWKIN